MSSAPWKIRKDMPFSFCTADGEIPIGECYGKKQAYRNAAIVVHAVNMHDELVKALRDARSFMDSVQYGDGDEADTPFDRLKARTDAVLKKAVQRAKGSTTKGNNND